MRQHLFYAQAIWAPIVCYVLVAWLRRWRLHWKELQEGGGGGGGDGGEGADGTNGGDDAPLRGP